MRGLAALRAFLLVGVIFSVAAAVVLVRTSNVQPQPQVGSTSSSVAPGTSTPGPFPSSSRGPSAANCGSVDISIDGAPATVANRTNASTAVVIGTVQAIQGAQWNTADGTPPAFTEDGHPPLWAGVYRPVLISVSSTAKGTQSSSLTALLAGGSVGCYSSLVEGTPALTVGSRLALFLGPSATSTGHTASQLTIIDAWAVTADGSVQTPLEGTESISSFEAAVAKGN